MALTQQFSARKSVPQPRKSKRREHTSVDPTDSGTNQARTILALCLLLTVVTGALYSSVFRHPFLNYQDTTQVIDNQHIRTGLNRHTIAWAFTSIEVPSWQPLTRLSHALDYQIFGMEAGGHHATSLLLHLVNALLLFLLLSRATGAVGRSAIVAGLFALHPFNVESVAWVAERETLLCALFFLLALGAYGWYAQQPNAQRYLVLALLFLLSLASEPMAVTLPFILLLLDYWPLRRIQDWTTPSETFPVARVPWPRLVKEKLPLFALSVAGAFVTLVVHKAGEAVEPIVNLPLAWRAQNAIYSYAMYLAKLFWPVDFAIVYPHPRDTLTFVQLALSAIVLVGVSLLVWRQRTRHGYLLTGWLWFLGTTAPVIGVVQIGGLGMADHYAYIPAVGIFLIVVWGVGDWIRAASLNPRLGAVVGVAVLGCLSFVTYRQIGLWRNGYDLWKHALETTKYNVIAYDEMADLLLRQGRPEGIVFFERAAKLASWDPVSHSALGAALHDRGNLQKAIEEYNTALEANPGPRLHAHICFDLDVIYLELGDHAQARENMQKAVSLDPEGVQESIDQLARRVAARPAPIGYYRLGLLSEGANRLPEAMSAYVKALQLDPQFQPAMRALAILSLTSPPESSQTSQP